MYGVHPAFDTIFRSPIPRVEVRDIVHSTADLTQYTFTNVNLGDLGSVCDTFDTYGTDPNLRTEGKTIILCCIHARDALADFGVSSVLIGGQTGAENVDRNGVSNGINSAIYHWESVALHGITNTDVVVNFTEAVTACSIVILAITNVGAHQFIRANTSLGTGDLGLGVDTNNTASENYPWCIAISTLEVGGGAETSAARNVDNIQGAGVNPRFLYEANSADITICGYWQYTPQWIPSNIVTGGITITWSGATVGDGAIAAYV